MVRISSNKNVTIIGVYQLVVFRPNSRWGLFYESIEMYLVNKIRIHARGSTLACNVHSGMFCRIKNDDTLQSETVHPKHNENG